MSMRALPCSCFLWPPSSGQLCGLTHSGGAKTTDNLPAKIAGAATGRPCGGAAVDWFGGWRIKRRSASRMSALKRITDLSQTSRYVRKVPRADINLWLENEKGRLLRRPPIQTVNGIRLNNYFLPWSAM
jgi:hypothetical protein